MVIFIFLVWKYPFCVNLIQKFKRVILRRNLVPILECLIDAVPPPLPRLFNFFIFFPPRTFFFYPLSPTYELLGKVFNRSLNGYTYADFFAISQKE